MTMDFVRVSVNASLGCNNRTKKEDGTDAAVMGLSSPWQLLECKVGVDSKSKKTS